MNRRVAVGLALIVIGAALQLVQLRVITGDLTLLALGVALLAGYGLTGHYSLLVSGGVLTGLGAGLVARVWAGSGAGAVSLGLGLGFLGIYAIDQVSGIRRSGNWWPVVPGSILTALGILLTARATGLLALLNTWWPLVLVSIGLWMLIRRAPEKRTPEAVPPDQDPHD